MPFKRIWKCRLKTVVCVLTFRHLSGKILSLFNKRGPVAQLGARLNRTEEVRGSNPLRSIHEHRQGRYPAVFFINTETLVN